MSTGYVGCLLIGLFDARYPEIPPARVEIEKKFGFDPPQKNFSLSIGGQFKMPISIILLIYKIYMYNIKELL